MIHILPHIRFFERAALLSVKNFTYCKNLFLQKSICFYSINWINNKACSSLIIKSLHCKTSNEARLVPRTESELNESFNCHIISPHNSRVLCVAIIGAPNSGKSTLINKLTGWKICCVSQKVHTTEYSTRSIYNHDETQLVFMDTPGVVTPEESRKYRLKRSLLVDPEISLEKADLIAVVHDASNKYTRNRLHPRILRLLCLYPKIPAVLILNKVDMVKNKTALLEIIRSVCDSQYFVQYTAKPRSLTYDETASLKKRVIQRSMPKDKVLGPFNPKIFYKDSASPPRIYWEVSPRKKIRNLDINPGNNVYKYNEASSSISERIFYNALYDSSFSECKFNTNEECETISKNLENMMQFIQNNEKESFESQHQRQIFSENQISEFIGEKIDWPFFRNVFMVSARSGCGISDLKRFFLNRAVKRPWIFNSWTVTDQNPYEIAISTIRSKCLEHLFHAIPYELEYRIVHWSLSQSDVISIFLDLVCKRKRFIKTLIGPKGNMAKKISVEAEQDLRNVFRTDVKLKINFVVEEK